MEKNKPQKPNVFTNIKYSIQSADLWSHVYGVLGVVSLSFTIVFTIISIRKQDNVDYMTVVVTLAVISFSLLITFLLAVGYYQRKIKRLNNLPTQLYETRNENDRLNLKLKAQSECSHTINHYFRNIENRLDCFLIRITNNDEKNEEEECKLLLARCKDFLVNTTTSLQSYFTIASGYSCAVTIKMLLHDEKKGINYVRTLFRDPLSLKKRRYVDGYYSGIADFYDAKENTAFDVILSPEHVNDFYASDDLQEEYKKHRYKNSNRFWTQHYNSTIVVPVSIVLENKQKNVIGFVAIDNLTASSGNLNNDEKIEFLFSIGDLFYNFMDKYLQLISFANSKIKIDDFHKRIITWS